MVEPVKQIPLGINYEVPGEGFVGTTSNPNFTVREAKPGTIVVSQVFGSYAEDHTFTPDGTAVQTFPNSTFDIEQ